MNYKLHLFKLLFALLVLFSFTSYGQAPQMFNYQGIARDIKGNPLANQAMTLKLSVLPTADAINAEYEEIQSVTTNEFGLYTLQIGNGKVMSGNMKTVKWETGNKYIKVAIDPIGGNNFIDAGTSQLLSVPYAIYADRSGSAKEADHDKTRTGGVVTPTGTTGDANMIAKFNGTANTITNSQIFDNGNGIGIGTLAPAASAKVHIISASGTQPLILESPIGVHALFRENGLNRGYFGSYIGSGAPYPTPLGTSNADFDIGTSGSNPTGKLHLATQTTPRLTIDNVGLVGIGTTTPTTNLDVNGQIRIRGGSPALGKILTSDANGLATWENAIPGVQGPAGSNGLDGRTVLNGIAAPINGIGENGDFYLNTLTNEFYGPKSGGLWSLPPISLVGPQGPIGADGPQGIPGAVGPQGPIGLTGAVGPQGPIGLTGVAGPQGANGVAGANGAPGAVGPQGPIGLTGAVGPQGPIGLTGVAGPQGANGVAGANGAPGAVGPQGPIGLTGAVGPQGPIGLTGVAGPQGANGVAGANGAPGAVGPVGADGPQGVPGAVGPQGPIGLTGAVGPQGPIGLTGVAGPQGANGVAGANGAPGAVGPVGADGPQGIAGAVGPQGPIGLTGAVGPQGPIGADGPQGIPGAVGPQGPIGLTGAVGPQGPIGLTGVAGPQGANGVAGANGAPGAVGPIGADGPQGIPGAVGPQGPIGLTGLTGAAGPIGADGPQGIPGAVGPQGPIGLTGAVGPQGPIGLTGAVGPQGPIGLTGVAGPQGANGVAGANGAPGAVGPIGADGPQGIPGAVGPQGPIGLTGAVGPQGPIGLTGVAGPQGANGVAGANGAPGAPGAVGPVGADGPQGIPGAVGPQGPIGLTGAVGPQGPIGLTGVAGPQGANGVAGANGAPGAPGAVGPIGADGPQGIPGAVGPQGPIGLTGAVGPQGPIGLTGVAGPQGANGVAGANGAPGAPGAVGPVGADGPQGIPGAVGPQGPIGLTGAVGPQGVQGLQGVQGPQGIGGTNGKTILNGNGAPNNALGFDNDLYLDVTTNQFYGPKSGGVWTGPFNIAQLTGGTLSDGKILVGNASNVSVQVAPSGDVTMSNTGVNTIQANSVDGTNIELGTETNGQIMQYNGTDWVPVTIGSTTTHTLANPVNTITSVVNGVSVSAPAVNTVGNTSSVNSIHTTVNGVSGTDVNIINSNTTSLTKANGLVNTINGEVATQTIGTGTVTDVLGFDGSGNAVYKDLSALFNGATSVSNLSTGNTLTTSVNGVTGAAVNLVNTNTLSSAANTMTNATNGVSANAPIVNSISNTTNNNLLHTEVNGISGTDVNIITSNTNTLSKSAGLVNTINGTVATQAIPASTITDVLGFDASGNPVNQSLTTVLGGATSVSNSNSGNVLTTTVNGVTGAGVNVVTSITNTSTLNKMTTAVNGQSSNDADIINTNELNITGTSLTSKINGISSNAVDINAGVTKGDLTEITSNVLNISNGVGAVLGAGTSIEVKENSLNQAGFVPAPTALNANKAWATDALGNPSWTTATGTGDIVRSNTPTLVTPILGVATGTSLNLSGTLNVSGATTTTGITNTGDIATTTLNSGSAVVTGNTSTGTLNATGLPVSATPTNSLLNINGTSVETISPADLVSNALQADNGTAKGTGANSGKVVLGGTLNIPTSIATDGTNTLTIRPTNIGGASTEANQGFNVLATAADNKASVIALRGRVSSTSSNINSARGVSGAVNLSGGSINANGGATGGYFNTNMTNTTLNTNASITGVSADAEDGGGNSVGVTNSLVGARFGANASAGSLASTVGVLLTSTGSAVKNLGVVTSGGVAGLDLLTHMATLPAVINTGIYSYAPVAANSYAAIADGKVQLLNTPVSATPTNKLLNINADNVIETISPAALVSDAIQADNGTAKGTGANSGKVVLGGTLNIPTSIATDGTNTLTINPTNIGGNSVEANQGLNVLATAAATTSKAVALRGRVLSSGTISQVRGVSGAANLIGGTVNGTATGAYFNTNMSGTTLATDVMVTGVSADAEATGANTVNAGNTLAGARFGGDATSSNAAKSAGVVATAVGSVASNIGVATSANMDAATLNTRLNSLPANTNAAIVAYNPGAAATDYAAIADGKVQLLNTPASATPTNNLLNINADNVIETISPAALVSDAIQADNGTAKGTGANAGKVVLGGTLNIPTSIATDGTNTLTIRPTNIGGASTEANQGFNVLATAADNKASVIALRGRVSSTSSTINSARGVSGAVNLSGGSINANGGATGGYFNTNMTGTTLGAYATITGVSADAEVGTGNSVDNTNSLVGARFGADATNAPAANTVGVLLTSNGSTSKNLGVVTSGGVSGLALLTQMASLPSSVNTGLYSYAPIAANSYAAIADGKVQLRNTATGTAFNNLLNINADHVVEQVTPASIVAVGVATNNGISKSGTGEVILGGTLNQATTIATAAHDLSLTGTGNFNVANNVNVTGTTTTGALAVTNASNLSGNVTVGASKVTIDAANGNTAIAGTLGVSGITSVINATNSTSATNGALVVSGGVGIQRDVTIGGKTTIGSATASTIATLNVIGGLSLSKDVVNVNAATTITIGNRSYININNTVASTQTISLAAGTGGSEVGQIVILECSGNPILIPDFSAGTYANTNTGGLNLTVGSTAMFVWSGTAWLQVSVFIN